MNTKIGKMYNRYSIPDTAFFSTISKDFVLKPYEKLSRKDVKKNVLAYEKIIAQIPDSVKVSIYKIDSFYTNKNKIEFIIKNKIKTKNKYMIY